MAERDQTIYETPAFKVVTDSYTSMWLQGVELDFEDGMYGGFRLRGVEESSCG